MKKLLLTLALSVSLFAAAQNNMKFGVNAGATLSDIRGGEYTDEFKPGLNYLLGVTLEIPLSERLSFSGNINYEKKSVRYTLTNFEDPGNGSLPGDDPAFQDFEIKTTTTLHYLSIPLNLKYYIGTQKNFFVNMGPFASILVDQSYLFDGKKVENFNNIDYRTLDYGFSIGAGTKLKLTDKYNLNIEIRDNLGLADILDDKLLGKTRTNSINLIVNWQFTL